MSAWCDLVRLLPRWHCAILLDAETSKRHTQHLSRRRPLANDLTWSAARESPCILVTKFNLQGVPHSIYSKAFINETDGAKQPCNERCVQLLLRRRQCLLLLRGVDSGEAAQRGWLEEIILLLISHSCCAPVASKCVNTLDPQLDLLRSRFVETSLGGASTTAEQVGALALTFAERLSTSIEYISKGRGQWRMLDYAALSSCVFVQAQAGLSLLSRRFDSDGVRDTGPVRGTATERKAGIGAETEAS
eukprot:1114711-Pleurochrysis_carterae.AAC.4